MAAEGGGTAAGTTAAIRAAARRSSSCFSCCSCSAASVFSLTGTPSSSIAKSTVAREALPSNAVTETGYYTDADGDWIHNQSELTAGLRKFYQETGVQPYVYILPNGESTSVSDLKSRAEALYPQLFSDEGHFLLVFCDDGAAAITAAIRSVRRRKP